MLMPKINTISRAPQISNRFSSPAAVKFSKSILDQGALNATIKRIKNVKAAFANIPRQGQKVSDANHKKAKILASSGADRAKQLRGIIDKSVGNVQQSTSQDVAGKNALIEASSRASTVESGKGGRVNSKN